MYGSDNKTEKGSTDRRSSTSSVPGGQVVSLLELNLQFVHAQAGSSSLS